MIGGYLVAFVGTCLVGARPTAMVIAHHRWHRSRQVVAALPATPLPPHDSSLSDLVARAEAALEADALSRGVRGIIQVYEEAAR